MIHLILKFLIHVFQPLGKISLLKFVLNDAKNIIHSNIYRPPKAGERTTSESLNVFFEEFNPMLENLKSNDSNICIAGDFIAAYIM